MSVLRVAATAAPIVLAALIVVAEASAIRRRVVNLNTTQPDPSGEISEETRYKAYVDFRRMYADSNRETSKLLDQSLLTLAGGALGLSLTFIRQVFPSPTLGSLPALLFAWVLFGSCILATLISLITSGHANERTTEQLDEAFYGGGLISKPNNIASAWTGHANVISMACFINAVWLLAWFVIQNLI